MRSSAIPIAFLLAALCALPVWAQPQVTYLDPPSLGRGKKNRVALVGEGIDRAKDLWTSLPAGKLKVKPLASTPQKSEFEIEPAADCPLGIYGLRLATEDGLSNLHLFVVEDVAPAALKDPQAEFPASVCGVFRAEQVDRYRIEVKEDGQRIAFDIVASRLGTDADPLLVIYDAEGRKIAEHDNDAGLFFDGAWEQTFAAKGIYTVEVRDARFQGAPHWRYLLRMGTFPVPCAVAPSAIRPGETAALSLATGGESIACTLPREQPLGGFFQAIRRPSDTSASWFPLLASPLPSVVEVEPNDTPEQSTSTSASGAPLFLHGVFAAAGDKDHFTLDLKKGQRLVVRGETRPVASAADLELVVLDPTGKEIARADDTNLPGGALDEGSLNFSAGVDGAYKLLVREASRAGGPGYGYRVEIRPVEPRIQLTSDVASITLPQGSYQVLPLTVTRTDYTGPIVLSLVGAPGGVSLEPRVIAEGQNTVLCRVLATAGAPQGVHTLGIAAAGQAGETTLSARVAFQPLVDKQLVNVDLIRHALRDNQRWLPPSVTGQIALQITPPSPFTVELPDAVVTLPRYLQTALRVEMTRVGDFAGDVTFSATGGQVGEESQGRRQVFVRYPQARADQPSTALTFHSRSQANDATDRVDVTAAAQQGPRRIELKRSFTLAVKPAFEIAVTPAPLALLPGETARLKLTANRLAAFQGAVTINPTFGPGVTLPDEIKIPAGQESVEVDLTVAADFKPGRTRVRFPSFGQVAEYQEEPRTVELDVEVKAPPKAK